MRRGVIVFLFMLSAFWQAAALAGHALALAQQEERLHSAMHLQEVAHHHEDDGTVVIDDSQASIQHVALDGSVGTPPLGSAVTTLPAVFLSHKPTSLDELVAPSPDLSGPRRPPRARA